MLTGKVTRNLQLSNHGPPQRLWLPESSGWPETTVVVYDQMGVNYFVLVSTVVSGRSLKLSCFEILISATCRTTTSVAADSLLARFAGFVPAKKVRATSPATTLCRRQRGALTTPLPHAKKSRLTWSVVARLREGEGLRHRRLILNPAFPQCVCFLVLAAGVQKTNTTDTDVIDKCCCGPILATFVTPDLTTLSQRLVSRGKWRQQSRRALSVWGTPIITKQT